MGQPQGPTCLFYLLMPGRQRPDQRTNPKRRHTEGGTRAGWEQGRALSPEDRTVFTLGQQVHGFRPQAQLGGQGGSSSDSHRVSRQGGWTLCTARLSMGHLHGVVVTDVESLGAGSGETKHQSQAQGASRGAPLQPHHCLPPAPVSQSSGEVEGGRACAARLWRCSHGHDAIVGAVGAGPHRSVTPSAIAQWKPATESEELGRPGAFWSVMHSQH